jgi:hypothetical protein
MPADYNLNHFLKDNENFLNTLKRVVQEKQIKSVIKIQFQSENLQNKISYHY